MPDDATAARVERVPPPVTHDLRTRVLRPGAPPAQARRALADPPGTVAFAALDPGGAVVGVAVAHPEPCPWQADVPAAWRLRGMATEPARRSTGVGRAVLAAVVDHVAAAGGALLWCNARVPARRFYERGGFAAHGDPWNDPDLGPHVAMWRAVGPPGAPVAVGRPGAG